MTTRRRDLVPPGRVVLAGLLVACGSATRPSDYWVDRLTIEPLEVTAQVVAWWGEAEECAGVEGDIEHVTFLKVTAPLDGPQFPCFDGLSCNGAWIPPDSILISTLLVDNARTVKHEMLHQLLGRLQHTEEFFRCG